MHPTARAAVFSFVAMAGAACSGAPALTPAAVHESQMVRTIFQFPLGSRETDLVPRAGAPYLTYHGGNVTLHPHVYLVYMAWTSPNSDPDGEAARLESFVNGIGGSTWLRTVTQYTSDRGAIDNAPNQLEGTWRDDSPATGLIDEAYRASKHFDDKSLSAQFILLSPHNHNMGGFGTVYCSLRTFIEKVGGGDASPVATYLGYMPDAGKGCGANVVNKGKSGILDGVSLIAGAAIAGYQTDPHTSAWYHDSNDGEIADACWKQKQTSVQFSTGSFPAPWLWSNASNACVIAYTHR